MRNLIVWSCCDVSFTSTYVSSSSCAYLFSPIKNSRFLFVTLSSSASFYSSARTQNYNEKKNKIKPDARCSFTKMRTKQWMNELHRTSQWSSTKWSRIQCLMIRLFCLIMLSKIVLVLSLVFSHSHTCKNAIGSFPHSLSLSRASVHIFDSPIISSVILSLTHSGEEVRCRNNKKNPIH